MKKFQFLLLDAGPIIKLFELGSWEKLIERCHVTVARTVVEEAVHTGQRCSLDYICFPFEEAAEQSRIRIIDVPLPAIQSFLRDSTIGEKYAIDPGEAETLAFLANTSEEFVLCSADGAVFRVLGLLGKSQQGISLEEVLQQIGLCRGNLGWEYSKKFREKYTRMGRADSIQGRGIR